MTVLLTVLSVLTLWALLTVLVIGLVLILKTLQSVRGALERIAFGVRAIEQQTEPLGPRAGELERSLDQASGAVEGMVRSFADVQRSLHRAAPALRPRPAP